MHTKCILYSKSRLEAQNLYSVLTSSQCLPCRKQQHVQYTTRDLVGGSSTPTVHCESVQRCLYILVPGDSGFDEFPRAICDLGSRFTGNSTAIRQLVLRDANECRLQPHPLAVLLDTFLLVHHCIVHNTGQFHFVGAGRIRVEDDISVCDVLQGQRLPIHFSDGTRTGRTRNCHCWVYLGQDEGLKSPALRYGSPLLPEHRFVMVHAELLRRKGLLIEGRFVGFDLFPSPWTAAELDFLLRLLDIALAHEQDAAVELLQGFVIDVCEQMDVGQRNIEETKKKGCSLHLKRVTLWPVRCCEEWV